MIYFYAIFQAVWTHRDTEVHGALAAISKVREGVQHSGHVTISQVLKAVRIPITNVSALLPHISRVPDWQTKSVKLADHFFSAGIVPEEMSIFDVRAKSVLSD